ncbi:hypothetical protein [Nocardia sp. NPDC059239]|uniref:hypothetical protein n=1 Tax=unclassified Nocardia TaxID=2637762 RepID=UPI0036D1FAFD
MAVRWPSATPIPSSCSPTRFSASSDPEGAAAILFRDTGRAAEVAEHLCLTAEQLSRLGVIDGVVDTHHGINYAVESMSSALTTAVIGDRSRRTAALMEIALRGSAAVSNRSTTGSPE